MKALESTFAYYANRDNAAHFFERWRDEIPLAQLEQLLMRIPQAGSILDAGCGPGHHSHHLSRYGYEVVGIDQSAAAIEIAEKTSTSGIRPKFFCGDMRFAPFQENSFDAVWASGSLIHTPKQQILPQIETCFSLIKPRGFMAFTMQIERSEELARDGRYFEGYEDQEAVLLLVKELNCEIVHVSTDRTKNNTHSIEQEVVWMETIIRKLE